MSKIVYIYDEVTGEFISEYLAQESPLEKDVFITPIYCSELPPLKNEAGEAICFDGGEWKYKSDIRGEWFNAKGESINIDSLSSVIDSGWTMELPAPSQIDINTQRKAEILAELSNIDAKSIRPIREANAVRLADLDKQAQALRDEFKLL